jgi:hypothetical protein
MTWVINAALCLLLSYDLPCVALLDLVMDDVTLILTRLCGFTTLFLGS